jgi:hypothetical protein
MLSRLHLRIVALLGALLLGIVVWIISRLFPDINVRTIAYIGAFAIAVIFAFSVGPRRRQF